MTRKWEYRVQIIDFEPGYNNESEKQLNILGDAGWELVTAIRNPDSADFVAVLLKREKA